MPSTLFHGSVLDVGAEAGGMSVHMDVWLRVDGAGFIDYLGGEKPHAHVDDDAERGSVVELGPDQMLMPGFVDTHVHAAQVQYTGTGTDLPLMQWLEKYAFPSERRLGTDLVLARGVYGDLADTFLRNGTTTVQYFGVLSLASTKLLVDVLVERGQRAFVGKVAMDRLAPDDYLETAAEGVARTEQFIEYTRQRSPVAVPIFQGGGAGQGADREQGTQSYVGGGGGGRGAGGVGGVGGVGGTAGAGNAGGADSRPLPLVEPVITPRFVPCCTETLLAGLGELAARLDCAVQSHAVESVDCLATVEWLHPGRDEVEILHEAGLLTRRTVMAHSVHITEPQVQVFASTGTGIAHCPLSNFYFAGGALRCAALMPRVNIGLGTDVAGGYSPRMIDSVRHAVTTHLAVASADANEQQRVVAEAGKKTKTETETETTKTEEDRGGGTEKEGETGNEREKEQEKEGKKEDENTQTIAVVQAQAQGRAGNPDAEGRASRARCEGVAPGAGNPMDRDAFDYKHAVWLATVGGARCLGLEARVGRLEVGYAFDACLVDLAGFRADEPLTRFEKYVHLGDDRHIRQVWVQGRDVTPPRAGGGVAT